MIIPVELKRNLEDGRSIYASAKRANPRENIESQPCVLGVRSTDGNIVPLCTRGSMSMIVGKQKAGKSNILSMMAAAIVADCDVGPFAREDNVSRMVYIDTEMSSKYANMDVKKIFRYAGRSYDDTVFGSKVDYIEARSLNPDGLLSLVCAAAEACPGCVIILDGTAELVHDTNDNGECDAVVSDLMRILETYGVHIINTVHSNPTDMEMKARGHLGSALLRRCESICTIEKEKGTDHFIFKPYDLRGASFDDQHFYYDEVRHLLAHQSGELVKQDKKTELYNEIIHAVFNETKVLSKENLIRIKGCSARTAESYIKKAVDLGIVVNTAPIGFKAVYKVVWNPDMKPTEDNE